MTDRVVDDDRRSQTKPKCRESLLSRNPQPVRSGVVSQILVIMLLFAGSASATMVSVEDKTISQGDGSFTMNVTCIPTQPVKGWEFKVLYDPLVLHATEVLLGDFFRDYPTFARMGRIDEGNGTIQDVYALIVGKTGNISEEGVFAVLTFDVIGKGNTSVQLYDVGVCNETGYIPVTVEDGMVTMLGGPSAPPEEPAHDEPPARQPGRQGSADLALRILASLCLIIVAGGIASWGFAMMFNRRLTMRQFLQTMMTLMILCTSMLVLAGALLIA